MRKKVAILHYKGLGDWLMASSMLVELKKTGYKNIVLCWASSAGYSLGKLSYSNLTNIKFDRSPIKFLVFLISLRKVHGITDVFFTGKNPTYRLRVLRIIFRPLINIHGSARSSFRQGGDPDFSSKHNSIINDFLLSDFFKINTCIDKEYYLPFRGDSTVARRIIIHPGGDANNKYRRWPIERFIELGKKLKDNDFSVFFLIGPEERDLCNSIEGSNFPIIQPVDIEILLMEISKSEIVICSDSGIGHFGAALNKAVFTIFGPADPRNSRPIGKKVCAIESEYEGDCMPCVVEGGARGCAEKACLKSIEVDRVLRLILNKG